MENSCNYRSHFNFSNRGPTKTINNIRVMKIAENSETTIPNDNVSANPLINDVEKMNKMAQTIREFKLLSRMEGQARPNPSLMAAARLFPWLVSSFIRAKIKMLASTAIPMDKINPPIPAKVKVTGTSLKMARVMATYIRRATEASNPGKR